MTDSIERVVKKENELSAVYDRMDQDSNLSRYGTLLGERYQLTDDVGKKIPRSISVTLNDAINYGESVVSATQAAIMQTLVEGLSEHDNGIIERFLDRNIQQSDERRRKSLHNFVSDQANRRGIVACRWISYLDEKKGVYIPDCLPMDSRYLSYEEGKDGIYWYGYRTSRTKMAIEKEYGKTAKNDTAIPVIEYWDGDKGEVWIDGVLAKTEKNPIGEPPAAIQGVDRGDSFKDDSYLVHEHESIYWRDRYLYDELNRIASIEATINLKLMSPAYQKETSDPQAKPVPYPDMPGTTNEVPVGEKYSLLQVSDINNSSRQIHADIMRAISNGSISDVDYGNLSFPLSAVAINDLTDIKNKIMLPTFNCLSLFYRQLYRLIIQQFIKGGYTDMPVGRVGNKIKYSVADLGDPDKYTININFMSKTKRQEIANLSMAVAAKGTLPREVIYKEFMQAQNPDEWAAKMDSEEAETIDPAIKLYRIATSLLNEAEDNPDNKEADRQRIEAKMMGDRAVDIIKQRKVAAQTNPQQNVSAPTPQRGNAQPLIAAFSQGASRTGGDQTNNKERYSGSQV